MNRFTLPLAACLIWSGSAWAGSPELATVESATEVVRAFSALPVASIPPAMLRDAAGVAIIPDLVKAGFLVGGRYGCGVVLPRLPDGTWGDPVFVKLAGGGFGLQAGIQSADVILVFKTAKSLDRVLAGKGKVTLGGDIGIAAGPVGRQAEAATDGQLKAEIYSYSRSRGLFAGVSLEGAAMWPDDAANRYFARERGVPQFAATKLLKEWLASQSTPPVQIQAPPVVVPVPLPVPPPPGR
jgi:lipid-binding SYLF domain-containing protein